MPALFVPEEQWGPESWGVNHPRYVAAQITHGLHDAGYGYWGFSPSADPTATGYSYGTFGVDAIGMLGDGYPSDTTATYTDYGYSTCPGRDPQPLPQPGDYGDGIVTPHAAFLALDVAPGLALDNLRSLAADFPVYGPDGFADAVAVGSGQVSAFQLPLDQGMTMAAIANFLTGDALQDHFAPEVEAAVAPLLAAEQFWP